MTSQEPQPPEPTPWTFAEHDARLRRLELRLDDLDATLEADVRIADDGARSLPALGRQASQYDDVVSWMRDYFAVTFVRPVGGELRWCRRWQEHPEAVGRLDALWRAWEALRDETLGMATWYRDHLDPQLAVLLSSRGPFAVCTLERHQRLPALPVEQPPSPCPTQSHRPREVLA